MSANDKIYYYDRYPHLREKLSQLPDSPGCYLMKNAAGRVIYVGKAVSLRSRVRSYFQAPEGLNPKTAALVEKIADLETIVVKNEQEALILESQLIKRYAPHYNILLRDDKHYPYLRLTLEEKYPRLLIARRASADGSRYFGPYPQAGAMHHSLELIKKLFPLRQCKVKSWPSSHRPCLNEDLGLCKAPCAGHISEQDYRQIVEQVIAFLKGENKDITRRLEAEMDAAAGQWRFEDASRIRDLLRDIKEVQLKQDLDHSARGENFDVIASAARDNEGVIQVFFIRSGKVIGRESFAFSGVGEDDQAEMIAGFLLDYYGSGDTVPRRLFLSVLPAEASILADILRNKCGHQVALTVPQRGEKKRLLNLAEHNAELNLNQYLQSRERQAERAVAALESLKQALALPAVPARIECFDISHFQGSYTVASMVVAEKGNLAPKLYRRFRIKTVEGVDDFASLQEAVMRRFQRGQEEREQGKEPLDFGRFPDLLVIDGGKGQLSAVCKILQAFRWRGQVISLAKENEEIYLPNQNQPLVLTHDNLGLQLLQQVRDEAHRFAITYHRALRKKNQTISVLEDIPGIGPERRIRLLRAFGTLKAIKAASAEELAAVPTMSEKLAQAVYDKFHGKEENIND